MAAAQVANPGNFEQGVLFWNGISTQPIKPRKKKARTKRGQKNKRWKPQDNHMHIVPKPVVNVPNPQPLALNNQFMHKLNHIVGVQVNENKPKKKKVRTKRGQKNKRRSPKNNNLSPKVTTFVAEDDEKKQADDQAIDTSKYAVNYKHVRIAITEFADSIKTTDDHSGFKLVEIYQTLTVSEDDLKLWPQINSKESGKNMLNTLINYAEKNSQCTADVKTKLRIITKMIMEGKSQNDYIHIFLLLASHGNVCNVMKSVAINNAYGMMTNNLSEYIKSQSLKQQILRVLRDYRVLLVEKLFHSFGFYNNTHYIAGFHNHIAEKIGVVPYNDPDISHPYGKEWRKGLDQRYFKTLYTIENILECVMKQIEEKKIGYQKVVKFFEDHCPENMIKNEFLQEVIDIDTGKIDKGYMVWLLEKLEIFEVKADDWKEIEKCWDDI